MTNDPSDEGAEAYRWAIENPKEDWIQRQSRNLEPRKQIPRRRLGQNDSIGYGRPPTATRWKSGQSGNPKGRPEGSKSHKFLIREMLTENITIRVGGKARRVTRFEAVLLKQLDQALRGDHKAIQSVCALANTVGLLQAEDELPQNASSPDVSGFTDDELHEFQRLLDKANGGVKTKQDR